MTIIDARARFIRPVERKKFKLKFKRPTEQANDESPPPAAE